MTFEMSTDSPSRPVLLFGLKANLLDSFELTAEKSGTPTVNAGDSLNVHYRVLERKINPAHNRMSVAIGGQASAELGEVIDRQPGSFSTIEETRKLVIRIPPSKHVGRHTEELIFRWSDGTERRRSLQWRVDPLVAVDPPTKIVSDSGGKISIPVVIRSVDRPIRILGIEGNILESSNIDPRTAAFEHRADLTIVPSRNPGLSSRLLVKTDHPEFPETPIDIFAVRKGAQSP